MIAHDSWWSNGSARSTIINYHRLSWAVWPGLKNSKLKLIRHVINTNLVRAVDLYRFHEFSAGQFFCLSLSLIATLDMIIRSLPFFHSHELCWIWVSAVVIWGHVHFKIHNELSLVALFTLLHGNTVPTSLNQVNTAVHGCNSWISVWTLSWCCRVQFST